MEPCYRVAQVVASGFPVLLYDGACGLCASSVQRILRHERRRSLRFASLDGRFAASARQRHPELTAVDSMVWIEADASGERVFTRSEAALRAAAYLGGVWRVALVARLLPRGLRDGAYDFIARHRHRLPVSRVSCPVPSAPDRSRFLD